MHGRFVDTEHTCPLPFSPDLKSEQAALKAALISVLQRVENLEKEKASTDNRLASLEASNTNLTSHLQDVQRENEQLKQIVSSFTFSSSTPGSGPHPMVPTPRADYTVAFSARQSHPVLDSGVPVLYDDVLLNLGHGYHNVTGQFVAPVSGVYMFMGTVLPASNSSTPPTLIILDGGGTEMVMVTSTSGSGQGFGAVLLELSQGDRVSTREDYEQDMSGRQESDGGLLAFSGFLVSMEV
ncbi:hypothetical protein BaRGS_00026656 [Batillaria attramentaria]|uniref:C1q domain-containing protein n=1 Tax=Batillaria attramentaria TaxID=370345 RepID=A0ABD0K5G7_9CAEN